MKCIQRLVGAASLPRPAAILLAVLLGVSTASAQEFANIEYLCADWGPAMKLPAKAREKVQFSDTEEEVYFLKQVGRFTRGITGEQGKGINIYLCKMKPDGSAKTEIRELWHDVRYPIDTQAQSTWMDVNDRTKKIALSITYAGSDLTGLWTINLDGSDLRRIIVPQQKEKSLQAIDSPSWTPDGQWVVFAEIQRGTHPNQVRVAKCDLEGKRFAYLTDGPWQEHPAVSPDGSTIVYTQVGDAKTGGLYEMGIDGKNQHALLNPKGKLIGGTYPAWSPDGKKIFGISMGIVDAADGRTLLDHRPMVQGQRGTCGWAHWGRSGFIGLTVGGILFTDSGLQESKWVGSSKLANCSGAKEPCAW